MESNKKAFRTNHQFAQKN